MKKIRSVLFVVLFLFLPLAFGCTRNPAYAGEVNDSTKAYLDIQYLTLKSGTQAKIRLCNADTDNVKWHVNNNIRKDTGEKIIKIEVQKDGCVNVKALMDGQCTISVKVDGKWLKCPVTVKKNSFQEQTTETFFSYWLPSKIKGHRSREVHWNKIKGADGYVIYTVSRGYCKKIGRVQGGFTTKIIDDTPVYSMHKEYYVLGYKTTKSNVRIYTKDIYKKHFVRIKGVKGDINL